MSAENFHSKDHQFFKPAFGSKETKTTSRIAILFPGQGSQRVGMGKELLEKYGSVRKRFKEASDIFGFDIAKVCFEGPQEKLNGTAYAQAALFVVSFSAFEVWKSEGGLSGHEILMAGLSVGEFTAAVASGAVSFEKGANILKVRSKALDEACRQRETSMFPLAIGDEEAGKLMQNFPGLDICLRNPQNQLVIGGPVADLDELKKSMDTQDENLKVQGAFHSRYMKSAQVPVGKVVIGTKFKDADFSLILNGGLKTTRDRTEIQADLIKQTASEYNFRGIENNISLPGNRVGETIEMGQVPILSKMVERQRGGKAREIKTTSGYKLGFRWQRNPQAA